MFAIIGVQNSSDNRIISAKVIDSGILETTGKILNNSYNSLDLVQNLINGGTNEKIDVSSIVGIDNYMWGVLGFNYEQVKYNSPSDFLGSIHELYCHYAYLFSKADNKWYVVSIDDKEPKSLDEELAKL